MPSDSEPDSLRFSGNARSRQSGSGHLAVLSKGPDTEPVSLLLLIWTNPKANLRKRGVDESAFKLHSGREGRGGKPRSEPDSGNPTVRDRRGAYGNVDYGSRTEARRETCGTATEP
jgi:hypothetical protein